LLQALRLRGQQLSAASEKSRHLQVLHLMMIMSMMLFIMLPQPLLLMLPLSLLNADFC
jgi:hypothetical protein